MGLWVRGRGGPVQCPNNRLTGGQRRFGPVGSTGSRFPGLVCPYLPATGLLRKGLRTSEDGLNEVGRLLRFFSLCRSQCPEARIGSSFEPLAFRPTEPPLEDALQDVVLEEPFLLRPRKKSGGPRSSRRGTSRAHRALPSGPPRLDPATPEPHSADRITE